MDMDVRREESQGTLPDATAPGTPRAGGGRPLELEQMAAILGQRRCRELRIARGFRQCRGLSREQLEDLYQETTLALLQRSYQDEKHVCDALRTGIKRRALNLYRDERCREKILADSAPAVHAAEQARSAEEGPEEVALARQDRLLIGEFLAELTLSERHVFWLSTEGMKYNRIAKTLGISANEARNTVASCERKRERFQLLHDSGRLCGYRAATIKALLDGQTTSEQLVQLAAAHLQACAHCRAEHKTNAGRLRRAFQEQAVVLLPPTLTVHLGWLTRASIHTRTLTQRIRPDWVSIGQGGARERAVALLAGGGASAKLATGIATVAVIAGASITATHALKHRQPHPHHHSAASVTATLRLTRPVDVAQTSLPSSLQPPIPRAVHRAPARHRGVPGHVVAIAHETARRPGNPNRREPGGFAYLGVPTRTTTPAPAQQPAQTAQAATHTGGPFSP
jgi:RNA polymerase sigma factor (sigma-70 family)